MHPLLGARSGQHATEPAAGAAPTEPGESVGDHVRGRDLVVSLFECIIQIARRWRARLTTGLRFQDGRRIRLGRAVRLARGVVLDARGGTIVIGADTWVGAGVVFLTGDPDRDDSRTTRHRDIHIAPGVCLETEAIILAGVTIGTRAVVGARAVVRQDVPDYSVVAGCPARAIGRRLPETGCLDFFVPREPRSGASGSAQSRLA